MASPIQNYRTKFETKRKNRFYLIFPSDVGGDLLQAAVISAGRPSWSVTEQTLHHLNVRWFLAGKPTWDTWSCSFYDYLTDNTLSELMYWFEKVYNIQSTKMETPDKYKKDVIIQMLGPELEGDITDQYKLYGCWPTNVKPSDLDMTSEGDISNIDVTFRYDYAQKL